MKHRSMRIGRIFQRSKAAMLTRLWPPFSHLALIGDSAQWVLDWEMEALAGICQQLGILLADPRGGLSYTHQSLFFSNHLSVLRNTTWFDRSNRIGMAYFHGKPGTGEPIFDLVYDRLKHLHPRIARIQVTHSEMQSLVLETGIDPTKVSRIPIGIHAAYFPPQTPVTRSAARMKLGLPENAVIIGSFQKDGVGWEQGLTPKLVKGPDIFLQTIERLKSCIDPLFVLLSGPARGYVKSGLTSIGVPYQHVFLDHYPDIKELYHAIDLYLITSRQEGGPKAVLEAMSCGIPLVTTRVGQAMDLVHHNENGWMVDVGDVDALVYWVMYVIDNLRYLDPTIVAARATAEANTYTQLLPMWKSFLHGLVNFG